MCEVPGTVRASRYVAAQERFLPRCLLPGTRAPGRGRAGRDGVPMAARSPVAPPAEEP